MYKKITILGITLLAIQLSMNITQGMNQQSLTNIKLEIIAPSETKQPYFKKPENMTDKKFLLHLLEKTEFKQKLDQNDLKIFANTITDLCLKNKTLLEEEITTTPPLTPLIYSSRKCYPFIDGLFLALALPQYKTRTQQERELAKENAKKITKQLVSKINSELSPMQFFTGNKQSASIIGILEDIGTKNNPYTWKITYDRQSKQRTTFDIDIFKNGNDCGNICCELTKDGVTKKLKIYIASLKVPELERQQGFGNALLSTVIELASYFKKKTKIFLIADPQKKTMLQVLIKYYKEFGFSVHSKKPKWLKLYIDKNGAIIKPYELDAYINKLRNNRITTYLTGAKKLAEEICEFEKSITTTTQHQKKALKAVIKSGESVTAEIESIQGVLFLNLKIDAYTKQIRFLHELEEDKTTVTYLDDAANYQTYSHSGAERVINFIGVNTLTELSKRPKKGNNGVKNIPAYLMLYGENWNTEQIDRK